MTNNEFQSTANETLTISISFNSKPRMVNGSKVVVTLLQHPHKQKLFERTI